MITEQLSELMAVALRQAAADGVVELDPLPTASFERPRRREHGDWATNVALVAASGKGNPRAMAQALVERIPQSGLVDRVELAGPGFINFHLSRAWLFDIVRRAADTSVAFARTRTGGGRRINVEFVSANPTGPINVVSGRHAAVGDAVARLLEAVGYDVTREYYVNDAGRQILLFAQSVEAHYLTRYGVDASVPEGGYHGDYLADIAAQIAAEVGDRYVGADEAQRVQAMWDLGVPRILDEIKVSLERFGTTYDVWFSEREMHATEQVDKALARLAERGMTYENEGAVWFRSSELGDDKDRVLVRSNGDTTYLAADAAYLINKFGRGFDHLIYIWGADHHGTVPRLGAAARALDLPHDDVEILLVQTVSLLRDGEALKGSKRAGIYVPLDELVSEVGRDAARYTFLTRSIDAPLEFDIEAVKEQAPENPVFYVQYAHARISSILRKASEDGVPAPATDVPLDSLHHPSEDALMRKLATYEEVVPEAAEARAPHKIARYVEELASDFSAFYRDCRVVSDDVALTKARLLLCLATRRVVADALGMLGVDAPERM